MGYTNSGLVNYTRISPNRTIGRNCIDTISIHCVVGQCSVETLGAVFALTSKQASSNYGIGYDGRVGMYVEEKDRSWCTSNKANDMRAITIEVASDTTEPYAVRAAAYNKLIDLVTDICQRNGIKALKWSTSKNERVNHLNGCNMTVHRDYSAKSCPGTWLYERMGQIAAAVNERLGGAAPTPTYHYGADATVKAHTLSTGSYGPEVKTLQRILYARGITDNNGKAISVDGDFGSSTKQAVIKLQKQLGIDADGIVGNETWNKMLTALW